MVNRLEFFNSISGINYPDMLINFFDHFIALKYLIEDTGSISVDNATNEYIRFSIIFPSPEIKIQVLQRIQSGNMMIYNRPIHVSYRNISDTELKIELR